MSSYTCLVCEAHLTPAMPGDDDSPPWGATVFTAGGNYGSTVFDPWMSSREYLKVAICDTCLKTASGRVTICRPVHTVPAIDEQTWTPPDAVIPGPQRETDLPPAD